jgi:hypothetical protein
MYHNKNYLPCPPGNLPWLTVWGGNDGVWEAKSVKILTVFSRLFSTIGQVTSKGVCMKYNIRTGIQHVKVKAAVAVTALVAAAFPVAVALSGGAASAATGDFSLSGSATQQADGIHLISDGTHTDSDITFTLPAGTAVADLTDLEATIQVLTGTCGGGSPRFSVETASGNIFVYVGDAPNFTSCANGSTGNLLTSADLRVDTSQVGGTFYDTWSHAVSLAGSSPVTGLDLVVDGGWLAPQEFLVTSATVNATSYSFVPSKDSCKQGGWQTFTGNPGPFKNQGECVSWFNHNNGVGQDDVHAKSVR